MGFSVPESAPLEDKSICDLLNQGMDSRRILKAAYTFRRLEMEEELLKNKTLFVQHGLFVGMKLLPDPITWCLLPKWQGTYESELLSVIEKNANDINYFINIGCAEGYYLSGIARLFSIPCFGYDIDKRYENAIKCVAQLNELSNLIAYKESILAAIEATKGKIMILIDVDGSEIEVLNELEKVLSNMLNIREVLLFLETDQTTDLPQNEHYLIGTLRAQNTPQLMQLLSSFNYSIEQLITQDPSERFLSQNSNLSFLEQFVRGAEGRSGGQSWIMARKVIGR